MPLKILATKSEDEINKFEMKRNVIMTKTPAQIDAYIETNVTDLKSAKSVLKLLIQVEE